jgi:mycothiol synthase
METTSGWRFRAPARGERDAVAQLICDANVRVSGEPDFDVSDLEAEWNLSDFDLEHNAFVAERNGALAAYGAWSARRARADYDADYSIAPAHASAALERAVLDELERRVRGELRAAPAETRALLHVHADQVETPRLARYDAAGFAACRWFFRMGLTLDAAPAAPAPPPAGIEIRPCRRGVDEAHAYHVMRDAFRDHYRFSPLERDEWVRLHSGYDYYVPDLWLLAWHGDTPVGAAVNLLYPDVGMVDELGVRADWRGKKLGRALLDASFAAFWRHGQRRVQLGVDAGNATGATQLYENAGMRVLKTFVQFRKEITAGT